MTGLALLALLLPTASSSPTSLTQRDDFCGTDYYGYDWYCTTISTCCTGTWQSTCMPVGYTCCSTGYFCDPDEECVFDTATSTQYCVLEGDGPETTRSAESEGAKESGADDDDTDGDEDDSDDEEDGVAMRGVGLGMMSFVVGVGVAMALF